MRNIIIDTDPGHDDAVAIFLAAAHKDELCIKAITTVCGNNTLENVTLNAQYIMSLTNSDCIIAGGSTRPLISNPIISEEFHGKTGMDGWLDKPTIKHEVSKLHAVEVIHDILVNSKEKVTIVSLAPLTNIALLISIYPEIIEKIEMITLMGGGINKGNITEKAEFNVYVDPAAAKIVFNSKIPIVMSGLNVTEKARIFFDNFNYLRTNGPVGKFFCELMDFYELGSEKHGTTGCVMHDPCAVAYLLMPEIFSGIKTDVDVSLLDDNRGETFINDKGNKSCYVLEDVNVDVLGKLIIKGIESLDNQK